MKTRLALMLVLAVAAAHPEAAAAHAGHDHGPAPAPVAQPAPVVPAPQVLSSGQLRALKTDSGPGQPGAGLPGARSRVTDVLPDLQPAIQKMDARNADVPALDP